MDTAELLHQYAAGPATVRQAIADVRNEHWDAMPVADRWTIRQVVCHLADAEIVYADRIKRVLIEDNPTLYGWSPDDSVTDRMCGGREIDNELTIMVAIRRQVHSILEAQEVEVWQRTAVHNEDGPMTLETVVERITLHIPHHLQFVAAKIDALAIS